MPCFTYILRCRDGSYYVGHASDLDGSIARHNDGRGPAYTAARRPVELVFSEEFESPSAAAARERQIKRWTRTKKNALVAGNTARLHELARRRV